jgi:hypothetical protein
VNKGTSRTVTLSNPKGNGTATIASVLIQGSSNFTVASSTCGKQLAGGTSCAITVEFKPTARSLKIGELVITDNALNSPQRVFLVGIGQLWW